MSLGAEVAAPAVSRRELRTVFAGLIMALALAALDQNIVGPALPQIVSDLGGLAHLSWVVTAFLLASTTTTPLYGKLSDVYGRKPLFLVAIVLFLIGSALCGLAQTMTQLILFRGLQGLGAGGLMTLSQTIIADLISARERGRYQGQFVAVFAVCSVAGPLLGGLITDSLSWPWIFYVNLPIGAIALVLIAVGLHHPHRVVRHRIDYAGALLLSAGTTSGLLVLSWGGTTYAWSSPVILGLAAVAVVLFLAFIACERRATEPILPPHLFRNRVFVVASSVLGLASVAIFGAVVFLPLFFQLVLGATPSRAGLLMAPLSGGFIVSSVVGGRLVSRTGRYKPFPIVGLAVATVAYLGLAWAATAGLGVVVLVAALTAFGLRPRAGPGHAHAHRRHPERRRPRRPGRCHLGDGVLPVARQRARRCPVRRADDGPVAPSAAQRLDGAGRREVAARSRRQADRRVAAGPARGGHRGLPRRHHHDGPGGRRRRRPGVRPRAVVAGTPARGHSAGAERRLKASADPSPSPSPKRRGERRAGDVSPLVLW
jgi:EmrB/QacA subfamily drug resistance transporter